MLQFALIAGVLLYSSKSYSYNFGGISARLGKEIQNLNPFSLNTPEKRSEDFYKNAAKKEFDCLLGTSWIKLSDGYLSSGNAVIGEVRKLSKENQLLVLLVNTGKNLTCSVDNRDWNNGSINEMSACLIQERPLLTCKRTQN